MNTLKPYIIITTYPYIYLYIQQSTIGLLVFLGSNPVLWSSKKQSIVSHSSTTAELASTPADVAWLRTLFMELRLFLHHIPVLWRDNISTITLASDYVFHSRMKHI